MPPRTDAPQRLSLDDPLVFSRALGVVLWMGLLAVLVTQ